MSTYMQIIPNETRKSAMLFNCLGNPARLNLLALLTAEGEMFVGQMCERTGYTQPAISCQLRILRANELVDVRREGTQLFYSLADGFNGMVSRVHAAVDSIRKVSPKAPKVRRP